MILPADRNVFEFELTDRECERHSLEAIAELCGYQSSSALSRAFKTKFCSSPRNWLRQHRGEH